jgi:hypothetical protein
MRGPQADYKYGAGNDYIHMVFLSREEVGLDPLSSLRDLLHSNILIIVSNSEANEYQYRNNSSLPL